MTNLLAYGLLIVVVVGASTLPAGEGIPLYKITTKRDNDRVEVKSAKDKVVFSVYSSFGIGSAVIERMADKWSEAVVLRLHLKGLENFLVTSGKVKLEGAVSSQDAKVRLWKDGKEDLPLHAKNPFWMDVRIVEGDGTPAKVIPLKDGYFELPLPKGLFEGNAKSFSVSWVDFYRG